MAPAIFYSSHVRVYGLCIECKSIGSGEKADRDGQRSGDRNGEGKWAKQIRCLPAALYAPSTPLPFHAFWIALDRRQRAKRSENLSLIVFRTRPPLDFTPRKRAFSRPIRDPQPFSSRRAEKMARNTLSILPRMCLVKSIFICSFIFFLIRASDIL